MIEMYKNTNLFGSAYESFLLGIYSTLKKSSFNIFSIKRTLVQVCNRLNSAALTIKVKRIYKEALESVIQDCNLPYYVIISKPPYKKDFHIAIKDKT